MVTVTNIGTGSGSTNFLIPNGTVPLGSLIVVVAVTSNSNNPPVTVSDQGTPSNTYTTVASVSSSGIGVLQIITAPVTTALSGGNIGLSCSGGKFIASVCYIVGVNTFDSSATATNSNSSGSTSPTVTSGTPSNANEFFIGAIGVLGTDTFTQASGWASPPNSLSTTVVGTGISTIGGTKLNSGTGVQTYNPTLGTSHPWLAAVIAFSTINTYALSLAESGTASDTPVIVREVIVSLTESGTASETITFGWGLSLTESGTALEALSNFLKIYPTLSEIGSATDTPSSSLITFPSLSESGTAADTVSSQASYFISLSESGNIQDLVSMNIILNLSVFEIGNLIDTTDSTSTHPTSYGRKVRLVWKARQEF